MNMNKGRRISASLLAIAMIFSVVLPFAVMPASATLFGDANTDTTIDMRDVTKIARMICWLDPEVDLADANRDDELNVLDIIYTELIILERAPFPGGTLIAGLGRDPGKQYGYGAHPSLTGVYEQLVWIDYDLEPKPMLASRWDVSSDGEVWTFYLRTGVKFHDGTPFNAETAKDNFDRLNAEKPGQLGPLESIDVVGDYAIRFTHSEPFVPFIRQLSWPFMSMISPDAVDAEGKVLEPIGTGPYIVSEYAPDDKLVLVRNEDWWGGMPKLEGMTLRCIPDATSRAISLETGEIDLIIDTGGVLPGYAGTLDANPDIEVLSRLIATSHFVLLNCGKSPFDDPGVREAIQYAIDQETLVDTILEGYGIPGKGPVTPALAEWVNPDIETRYNPNMAEELLTDAGWVDTDGDGVLDRDGQPFEVRLLLHSGLVGRWPYEAISEVIQSELGDLGIDVEIQVLAGGAWSSALGAGEYEMTITPYTVLGPHFMLYDWFNSNGNMNVMRGMSYSNSRVDELTELGKVTMDPGERYQLYHEVQEIVMDEAPMFPIYYEEMINAKRDNVKGFEPHPWFWINWEEIYSTT
ncbi:MAG: putative ABC transporter periplasmic-binding protein [Candidatus Syntrophoarchaeum sp. GoM_oil]|nr:MAG: putative ABC transporter periplasmic-binding protein [Candidatus Syntrophoarchaeum sp. GoM_oil]